MRTLTAHLELSTNFDERTRERCPSLVFRDDAGIVVSIRTDVEQPTLPCPTGSIAGIVIYDDALSRVIDEEVWLAEFARVLAPGGEMRLTVPAEGSLGWLDAMNAYRYFVDITKRGDQPNAALPTGWNRHYRAAVIVSLLTAAGFGDVRVRSQNNALREVQMLFGLVWKNWVCRDRQAELALFPRFGARDPHSRTIPGTTTWSITARETHGLVGTDLDPQIELSGLIG